MTSARMSHVGIVVDDLESAIAYFLELGLELEGRARVEREPWADQLIGLDDVETDIAMVRTADGHSRIELSTFRSPAAVAGMPDAGVNTLGIPRIAFVVDDLDDTLERLRPYGGDPVAQIAQYEHLLRYVNVRGPAGVIVGLIEELVEIGPGDIAATAAGTR